ncbi:MAG: aminopeptidase P family protein [Candidatus Pelagibacterales bacterium]|nr:peptidase M24 [Candidatus Pelagibacter sp.]RZO62620.1 MAG: aminopeptidase P family protein [Pelagibacterales bacterium]|tara:strand:+ start:1664 stop:2899 length:1236 start_codon:yes stop_codon:yes gene_type:complete
MKFNRKIIPNKRSNQNFIFKKRLKEDEINFDKLRSYRLDRVKKELEKNNIEACMIFDPVNIRYALDTVNMSVYNMHNLTRYCFVPINGPVILYEYFNCEGLSSHLNLIDEVRPSITWDYFSNGNQAGEQLNKWVNEVEDLTNLYCKSKKLAIDVINGPAVTALNKLGIEVVDAKLILEQARVIKSPEELKCMKAAIEVAEIGIAKMREELKAGMTEDELWSILHKTNIENGGEWIECRILSSGSRTNPWMQESSNKVIQSGEIVSFDTDMVGPYGYCADISRTFVEGNRFSENQKKLYLMAVEQINYNSRLIKPGTSFKEFTEKSWKLPKEYYGNRYSVMVHGIGLCDEWPAIRYPGDGGERSGTFEKNMTITVESYIGKVGGEEGVKLEQQYLVGQNGLELMSHHPLENI